MKAKERLDIILTERNMFPSREKAKASIMAGLIYVDGQRVDKPGTPVDREAEITIKESLCPYVSRGGLKLEKALALYGFSLKDSVAVDIGASTGKPQFEAGREQVGKKGIVRDPKVHCQVIENVITYGRENGLYSHGLTWSPVTGAKGNIEYLLYMKKQPPQEEISEDAIKALVADSHAELES